MNDTADITDRLRARMAANKYNRRLRAELLEAIQIIDDLRFRLQEEIVKRCTDA